MEQIPYLSLVRPKGTFYLFPGIEKTGLSAGFSLSQAAQLPIFRCCYFPANAMIKSTFRITRRGLHAFF